MRIQLSFVLLPTLMLFPFAPLSGCTDDKKESQPIVECLEASPQGCIETDCDPGFTCVIPDDGCVPLDCACDTLIGEWACALECGGGVCLPEDNTCEADADCEFGVQWCEDGECGDCDNSGMVCDIDCGEGYELEERHGCFPCNCVPITECRADEDCDGDDICQAGEMCFFWCEAGDPTCCYGNTCVAP